MSRSMPSALGRIAGIFVLAWLMIGFPGCEQRGIPPNIILIMADDLGYETLGVNGSRSYQTPTLDALANSGMRFTHAYSTPLCTTSRVQIMTGQYNFRNYVGFGILDPAERTIAHGLKDIGYSTLVVGKWQLYGNARQRELFGRTGSLPEEAGFDEYTLWQVNEVGGSRFKDPYLFVSGKEPHLYQGEYGPDMAASAIEKFIEENSEGPFFVYYPMILTHAPFQPTPTSPDYESFDPITGGNDNSYFGENVSYMDSAVDRIINKLEELDLRENTLVIFIGDNGTDRRITSQTDDGDVRGHKGFTTSAGTHVPMIVNWPGSVPEGKINPNLVDFTDFFPTFLDAADVATSERPELDGRSFWDQLLGNMDAGRDWAFGDYAPRWGPFDGRRVRYIHNQEWKLYDDSLFFHFSTDPGEVHPVPDSLLAAGELDLKRRFQKEMDRLRK